MRPKEGGRLTVSDTDYKLDNRSQARESIEDLSPRLLERLKVLQRRVMRPE